MFIISQYLLNKSKLCNPDNISTYSIAIGLIIYSSIYLYLLYYNNDLLFVFNKFIIFIIAIDLLLSTFYHFNTGTTQQIIKDDLNLEDALLIENSDKIEEHLTISDDELTEDFDEDLDEEIQEDDESENLENDIQLQESYLEEIPDQEPEQEPDQEPEQEPEPKQEPEQEPQQEPEQEPEQNNLQNIVKQINEKITNKSLLQSNEVLTFIEESKPKAKRQTRKKKNNLDQVL